MATTPISVFFHALLGECCHNMVCNFKLGSFCLCRNETCVDVTGRNSCSDVSSAPAVHSVAHAIYEPCLSWHGNSRVYNKCRNLYLQLIYLYLQLLHITSSPPNMESNRDGTATGCSNYLPNAEIRREPTPPDTIVNANNYVHNNGNVPLHLCRHVIMQLLQLGTGFTGHR